MRNGRRAANNRADISTTTATIIVTTIFLILFVAVPLVVSLVQVLARRYADGSAAPGAFGRLTPGMAISLVGQLGRT